jgi:tetratricopeptide (TPR) repeat protein
VALWKLKQYKEALNSFEEVLRINPGNTEAQNSVKRLLQKLKQQQEASVAVNYLPLNQFAILASGGRD